MVVKIGGCFTDLFIQIKQMEEELNSVKGPGGVSAGYFKPMNLPENMATTSAEVIAGLNEHLVTVLQVNFLDDIHLKLKG